MTMEWTVSGRRRRASYSEDGRGTPLGRSSHAFAVRSGEQATTRASVGTGVRPYPSRKSVVDGWAAMSGLDFESGYLGVFVKRSGMTPTDLEMYAARYGKHFATADTQCGQAPSAANALRRSPYVHHIDAVWRTRHWVILSMIVLALLLTTAIMWKGVMDVAVFTDGTWLTGMWLSTITFVLFWPLFLAVQAVAIAADRGNAEAGRCSLLVRVTDSICWLCMAPCGLCRRFYVTGDGSSDDDSSADEEVMRQGTDMIVDADDAEPDTTSDPRASVIVQREGIVGEGLFTCGLVLVFLQITLYMGAFAYYYPQRCPQERGPYSCSRMHKTVALDKDYYPPRFDAFNAHPPCQNVTKFSDCKYGDNYPLSAFVPYTKSPPLILGSHLSGTECFGICCHIMPLLFAALWLMELRRLTGRLVARAFELSGAERDMADDALDEESKALRGRSILQFLAVVYHVILPHWRRSVMRLGTVILDFIDAQDFFLILLEFDVFEGKPISPDYLKLTKFSICNVTSTNFTSTATVTCNCTTSHGPPWWQQYSHKYDPCASLQEAAQEWWTGHNKIWIAEERWIWWHVILVSFLIGSFGIYLWPAMLYMRKFPSMCCRRLARRMGMRHDGSHWSENHHVDNRESFWNALRSLFTIELPFLVLRIWASRKCNIMMSSLILKNVLWAAADMNTIVCYIVWSWSDLRTWPEFMEFDPEISNESCFSAFPRWLCRFVFCCGWVPRHLWLRAMSNISPKMFLLKAPASVPPAHVRRALATNGEHAGVRISGRRGERLHALRYNDLYIMFDVDEFSNWGGDEIDELEEDAYLEYDDFDVEKHAIHSWTKLMGMS